MNSPQKMSKTLRRFFFALFIAQANLELSFAIDNDQQDRSRVVAPRNDRFYKNGNVRQYVNFSGEYESDENSKQYVLSAGHFYRSAKLINEVDFLKQTDYTQKAANKYELRRSGDLYDFQISSKAVVADTQNYLVFYNRSKYDQLSTYYYDITTAAGAGRMFFNDRLEIDVAIGHSDVKNYDQKTTIIPSFRAEFDITEKLHFIQRGYMFFSNEADDYQSKTRLQYLISKSLYLQVTHDFDKRRYSNEKKHEAINQVHRRIIFGFRYDLGGDAF